MTNGSFNKMVIKGQEVGDIFYQNNKSLSSPTKSKGRGIKNSQNSVVPRGKHQKIEMSEESEKNSKVRTGGYVTPNRGSPQGKHRVSPSKDRSPRLSPSHSDYYAGFSESPAPTALPKPPPHWMVPFHMSSVKTCAFQSGAHFQSLSCNFQDFKMLIKAQA